MNKFLQCVARIVLSAVVFLAPFSTVWAADEEIISSVYLEFNPETGEFAPVQERTTPSSGSHAVDNSTPRQATPAAIPRMQEQQSLTTATESGGISPVIIGGIVTVGLLIVIGFLFRKSQSKASA